MGHHPGEQFGDYRLVRLLGEGGFAEVYEAEHIHLQGFKAAIKLLKNRFTSQQLEILRREALFVSKLDHPHIVQLRTFSIERNIPYLVMAYAQGGALNQRHPRGTRLTVPQILAYVRPVAAALQYAHDQRIIHRDLKPANILLTQDGRVQVADFGIAVAAHNSISQTIQEIAGTWSYMAPEQFRGHAQAASDQYSLAIIIYQWLCGKTPFDGNGNVYLIPKQHQEEPPPSLRAQMPDLSPTLEKVIIKALAKDPRERFTSVQEFVEALEKENHPLFVPAPGQRLGDYQLVRLLGEGGFAEVYEAEHLHLETKAAIKLLKGTFTTEQVERLRQEARAIIQLEHPHIIRAYGFSIEQNVPYLIMAYAPGGSLATQHEQGTPLPLKIICTYVQQIASALHYAHSQQIIHCDIKPENILLAKDGRLQVADFGIALMTQNIQENRNIVGSWTYMAPEQFEGRAEPNTDQYALGVLVYQWLCGAPPFTGDGNIYSLPYQHMSEPVPSMGENKPLLVPNIEQVVLKALAKKPEDRFASVLEFAQAFEEACTSHPIREHFANVQELTRERNETHTHLLVGATSLTYKHPIGAALSVAWSPNGTHIASGGEDGTVHIWNAATGQTVRILQGHAYWGVRTVAWSPDGHMLASAGDDRNVQVWEVASEKLLGHYYDHTDSVTGVAWSSDGRLIASAGQKNVQVREAISGKLLHRYEVHTPPVTEVAWSPDGRLIASAGHKSVQVWEAISGKVLHIYKGHIDWVKAVAWSPDGRMLASAGHDRSAQVWEPISGKWLFTYPGHNVAVLGLTWSPDGKQIASAGHEVQLWVAPH